MTTAIVENRARLYESLAAFFIAITDFFPDFICCSTFVLIGKHMLHIHAKSLTATLLLMTTAVFSATALADNKNAKVEKELMQLENAMCAATLKNDVAASAKFSTDDYMEVNGDGRIGTKKESLEFVKNVKATVCENIISSIRVHDNTAVVIGKNNFKSDLYTGEMTFTDVFVKKNNAWLMITNHWSPINPTKK